MPKGDDALTRKKNKVIRKKLRRKNDSSTVSARVASIIASKKRRLSGKRRMCQGMCFSLPTPEDPFNDRLAKGDASKKKTKKDKRKNALSERGSIHKMEDDETQEEDDSHDELHTRDNKHCKPGVEMPTSNNMNGPSKYLMSCLNEIESLFRNDGTYSDNHDKSLFINTWGVEFWKCFSSGKDILETSRSSSTLEQIAWIVSTAAEAMAKREKEGASVSIPFLLFLVPSQSKASKVRSACKALKDLGIHTVSLHTGASVNHQISGLKSCEPEFLVSTPDRLLELLSLKSIDISNVSLLVVDELGSDCSESYLDALKSVKQAICGNHRTIVFSDGQKGSNVEAVKKSLLKGPISRISLSGCK